MGFSQGTQKILVVAGHPRFIIVRGFDRYDRGDSDSAIYLRHFLILAVIRKSIDVTGSAPEALAIYHDNSATLLVIGWLFAAVP